jgi:extracellular elastinolytic metalloproteinase
VTADWKQKVKAELLDTLSLKSQAIEFFDGQGRKSLVVESTSQKALTWGPFDNQMTVELTFYHMEQEGNVWLPISTIKGDKMLEVSDFPLGRGLILMFQHDRSSWPTIYRPLSLW